MFSWQGTVKMAILETDWTTMRDRVQAAESEILGRVLEIVKDDGGTPEEREALLNALESVDALRRDLAFWEEPAPPNGLLHFRASQSVAR